MPCRPWTRLVAQQFFLLTSSYSWSHIGAPVSCKTSHWLLDFSLWGNRAKHKMPGSQKYAHSFQTSSDTQGLDSRPTHTRESADLPHEVTLISSYSQDESHLGFLPEPALSTAPRVPWLWYCGGPISWALSSSQIYMAFQHWKWH